MNNNIKKGTIRDDGMIFWEYGKTYKNGEYWVTETKFKEKQTQINKSRQNRRKNNLTKHLEYERSYFLKNKERIKETNKIRYSINPLKKKESVTKYYHKNKTKIQNRQLEWRKKKCKASSTYKLYLNIRSLIYNSLKKNSFKKNTKTEKILGCSADIFKIYIQNKFKDGMSWENRNLWHIDHIIPISTAKNEEEAIKLNHYTNLQPLWAEENLKKSNKIPATK